MPSVLLADNFPLPPAVVTESVAIFGRKGSGKTYTGGRLFEQMHKIGAQCVVLDPVGNWFGLRLSASGKRRGLAIPVFGGNKGDIPITPQGGKLMAQSVVARGISCVIDLMNFRPAQRKEFATEFAEELFELKKQDNSPMHLFVEEARKFIPQQQRSKGDTRMIEAFEDIVRLGRNYGLGVSLLDQRPQSVNKEVTSQTEILIVHQLVEKLGRKEIEDWVRNKTTKGAEALSELDQLHTGEAFVWSPGLLRTFAKVKVGKKATYDASATPKVGEKRKVQPTPLSNKELTQLKTAMAEMVEKAEANDPSKLQLENRRLRVELEKVKVAPPATAKTVEKEVVRIQQVKVVDPALIDASMNLEKTVAKAMRPATSAIAEVTTLLARFTSEVEKRVERNRQPVVPQPKKMAMPSPAPVKAVPPKTKAVVNGHDRQPTEADEKRTGPELRILEAINWFETLGIQDPEVGAVAFLAGYKPRGGAFGNPRGRLRVLGLIDYPGPNRVALTDEGRAVAPEVDTPLTTIGLHQAVFAKLDGPARKILTVVIDAYPGSISNEETASQAGYDPRGGAYGNPRGRLKSLGLITYPQRGMLRAADLLFLGGDRKSN